MTGKYRVLDQAVWPRAEHCAVFRRCAQPQYCVSWELDISHFLARVRERGYAFTFAFIYAVASCANEQAEFRCRFVAGQPVLFERINTTFTYLEPGSELFKVVSVPLADTMEQYVQAASAAAVAQEAYFTGPPPVDSFIFSVLPWVSFTHISHTSSGDPEQAAPLFDWGKYFVREGRTLLPFAVQVHHSFVDGLHVGRLAERLQAYLDQF